MKSRREQRKKDRKDKKLRRKMFFDKRKKLTINDSIGDKTESDKRKPTKSIHKIHKLKATLKPNKSASVRHQRLIKEEDKEIKKLEKKLKLNKRKKKGTLPKSYHDEGLAYVLDVVNGTNLYDDHDNNGNDDSDDNIDDSDDHIDDSDDHIDEHNDYNSDCDESDRECNQSDDMSDSSAAQSDETFESVAECDTQTVKSDVKSNSKLREDIYGKLRDSDGNIIKEKIDKKEMVTKSVDINPQLLRQIRGALNRLTANNMLTIVSQIEEIYKQNSRHEVNEAVWSCIKNLIIDVNYISPQKLFSECTALLAILSSSLGEEVGGHAIHMLITDFDKTLGLFTENSVIVDIHSKKIDNIVLVAINLYICGLINSDLMFDIIDKLYNNFNEKSIELILMILKSVGFSLRKDNPIQLKELILKVQKLASNVDKTQLSGNRVAYIVDALIAIKNNNINKLSGYGNAVQTDVIEKILKNTVKKNKVNSISGSYDKILENSRFWMQTNDTITRLDVNQVHSFDTSIDKINGRLCKILRLNTPLRRSLFMALSSCSNYIDACNRLVSIGKKQYSEIINVIILVAINEQNYNQFYSVLLQHLSKFDRKFKVAIDFAIRDKITELQTIDIAKRTLLVSLIFELLKLNVLAITCLKVVQFGEMNHHYVHFIRNILTNVLNEDQNIIQQILSKIPNKDSFATAIRLFISCFIDAKIHNIKHFNVNVQ